MPIFILLAFILFSRLIYKTGFFFSLLFLLSFLLMAGNYDNPDFDNYMIRYTELYDQKTFDHGYGFLNFIFRKLGFQYLEFKSILSFISIYILYDTISLFSKNKNLVAFLYLIAIFPLDIIQIRFFYAFCISFFALRYLIQGNRLTYSIIIFLAASIHLTAIFYLVFLIQKKYLKTRYIISAITFIFCIKFVLYQYVEIIFSDDKANRYANQISLIAAIFICIFQIINLIYIKWFTAKMGKIYNRHSTLIISISYCFLLLIPFYFDQMIYSRIFRNYTLLIFIYATNYISSKNIYLPFLTCILFILANIFVLNNYWIESIQIAINNNLYF